MFGRSRLLVRAVLLCALALLTAPCVTRAQTYLGPCAIVASTDGRTLYVACADARQIAWVDVAAGKLIRRIDMPAEPTGMVLGREGSKLLVTCAAPKSTVCVIDVQSGETTARIPAGHSATGPTLSPDGRRLYVCNRFNNDLSVIDLPAGKESARVPVVREPVAAAATPDGRSVIVANHLSDSRADGFFVTAAVTIVDTKTLETTAIRLPNGAHSLKGVYISPDGGLALVTHILSNYELVPSQVDNGWTNINSLSLIDIAGRRLLNTVPLDDLYLGAGNPWGMGGTADGRWFCVAHAGTHELSVIDMPRLLAELRLPPHLRTPGLKRESIGSPYALATVNGIPSSMGIMTDLRRRVELSVVGPRSLAVIGSKAYVAGYFSDSIDVVDLQSPDGDPPSSIALGPRPRPTRQRRGEMLFHDAAICYQHWQSCSSCHPDARADGLNWDLRNDGVGNPKNTKTMLLSHRTPPSMATGIRVSAEAAVRAGIRHSLFTEQPEANAAAIDAYLKSLTPVPSPQLVDGQLSPAARRGKELFAADRVGCHRCHPAPLYTDLRMHEIGTQGSYDVSKRFDTPTLIEVWRTAPYLHDGRYTTIGQLITDGKHGLNGGRFDKLTEREIDELVEFVLSL